MKFSRRARYYRRKAQRYSQRVERRWDKLLAHPRIAPWVQLSDLFSSFQLTDAAAAMTYYLTLSLFPFAAFLMAVLANLSHRFSWDLSISDISSIIPQPVLDFLMPIVREVISQTGAVSFLSISALSLLWASSRGFNTFVETMDEMYKRPGKPYVLKKLLGLVFTVILTLMIVSLLVFISFGNLLLDKLAEWTQLPVFTGEMIRWVRLFLPFGFVGLMLGFVYYLSCGRKGTVLLAFFAALLPTVVWVVLSFGLSIYINNFTKFAVLYGSITGVILLLFWLFLLMQAIFVGAFVHMLLLEKREKRLKQKQDPEQ